MQRKSLLTYNRNLLSQTHPERLAESARAALRHLLAGDVRIDVSTEYAIDDLDGALERLSAGGTHGKSVIRIN
jgi:NADPH:quinone reductase-like Zn-dependent oxidoreductase